MAVMCAVTGKGHKFQSRDDPWMIEVLKNSSNLIFVVIGDEGTSPPSFIYEKNGEVKLTYIVARSTVDAIFKIKAHLDESKILEAKILIPEENFKESEAIKTLLFPEICKITMEPFPSANMVQPWAHMSSKDCDYGTIVKQYLMHVPTSDAVKTVQSNMLSSEMFTHGYTSRYGGVTTWPTMASLNLVYSLRKPDSIFVVKENARRLCMNINQDPVKYHLAKANHGNKVWVYEKSAPESYDGIVTRTPGVLVASPAADCNMLLLADPVVKACGAIHAGWKGILLGIVESAVNAMVTEYNSDPKNIIASLGPSLSVCCCEFGAGDSKKFLPIHEDVVVWKEGKEKPHIDLRLATRILLEKSGLKAENIDDGIKGSYPTPALAVCTKCDPQKNFFSFRRDGAKFGNQVAFISLK